MVVVVEWGLGVCLSIKYKKCFLICVLIWCFSSPEQWEPSSKSIENAMDRGVTEGNKESRNRPCNTGCSSSLWTKNRPLPKAIGSKILSNQTGWERRKHYFFHKPSLSNLLNMFRLLPPLLTSWSWFQLLTLHFGSKNTLWAFYIRQNTLWEVHCP